MQLNEARQGHRSKLNHVYSFIKRRLLRSGRFEAQCREVQMLPCGQDVVPHQPVGGYDFIEPGESPLVRVATIAVLFKDMLDFNRRLELGSRVLSRNAGSNKLEHCH